MKNIFIAFLAGLFISSSVLAHHSDHGIDEEGMVMVEGVITEFSWRNPHVYFKVETTSSSAQLGEWEFQMAATPILGRAGWDRDTLVPGDEVIVRGLPALDGRRYGLLRYIEKDGVAITLREGATVEETVSTDTLEGIWRGDRSTIGDFTAFFDRIIPTEAGLAAQAAFDAHSVDNPMSTCSGRPTPSTLASAGLYLSEIEFVDDTIIFRNEIFGAEKVVYMDGRGHPEDGERTLYGHSIGWWEGDTLIVDGTLFADHKSPYQNGIPSGAQKRVIEKYRLNENGTRIFVDYLLEDPEFIAEPLIGQMEWIYSPDSVPVPWECNEDSTRTFLPQ